MNPDMSNYGSLSRMFREHEDSGAKLAALRRFARGPSPLERCELCGTEIGSEHQHLFERSRRRILCSCESCAILLAGSQDVKFLRVPKRVVMLRGSVFDDTSWEAMMLPINLAFFVRQSDGGTGVIYPSPAGAMTSLIELPAWRELFQGETNLDAIEPETEALLVNRIGTRPLSFIAPIDACFALTGLIRTKWRGLSGGAEVWRSVEEFFCELEQRAGDASERSHA